MGVFQDKNLVSPEQVYNLLGNERFGKEWSDLPLKVLGSHRNNFKISDSKYRRNKHIADQIFKQFSKFLKDPNVTIYAPSKSWDEDPNCEDIKPWPSLYFRVSTKEFFLIEQEQEYDEKYGFIDMSRRRFWIEMPKEPNPMSFKKSGRKIVHDVKFMKSILYDVAELIEGKITNNLLAWAYAEYLKDKNIPAPKSSWIGDNLDPELSQLKESRNI